MLEPLTRLPLRVAMRSLYALMRLRWFFSRPDTRGAHAIALTPAGRIVLVKLRYVSGWRLPGGGVEPGEDPAQAVLRELQEEIGLLRHRAVHTAFDADQRIDYRNDRSTVFIVHDVHYAASWSWEIEAVTEALPDQLPPTVSPRTREWIERALSP